MGDLDKKVMLVTGGSRGVGAATVRAASAAGAHVVLHYARSPEKAAQIQEEVGPERCHLVGADLTEPGAGRRLWESAFDWRGAIDVLVNNAGIYEAVDLETDDRAWDATWERTLQANLRAPADLSRAAIPYFRSVGGGAIVNIESRAAFRGEGLVYSPYAASKGGMMAFGRTLARAYAGEGILVYGISPGWVDTDMAAAGIEELGRDYVMRDIPIGDIVPPAEIANLVVFLASGKARHVTGTSIDINGASYPR